MWAVAALIVAAAALLLGPWALQRWRWRQVPGPLAWPVVGNLPAVVRVGLHEFMLDCSKRYGKIFKMYFGGSMFIVVADPDLARKVNFRMVDRSLGRQLKLDKDDVINTQGLVAAKGEMWRKLRLAWQPAFSSGSLEGYLEQMSDGAQALAQHLTRKGEAGEEVELWRELGSMTLQVVGSTAYGVDFHSIPEDSASSEDKAAGAKLQAACATIFSTAGIRTGSIYVLLNVLFPWAARAISWSASRFPDARLVRLLEARRLIRAVSSRLIEQWRAAHPASISLEARAGPAAAAAASEAEPLVEDIAATVEPAAAAPAGGAAGAAGAAAKHAAPAPSADAKAVVKRAAGAGIEPGSFLDLMLNQRAGLSDMHVIAQANTFILAGYETTANTLSFAVYNIARHPRVQARLLAEVDAFGRDAPIRYADLEQFPYTEAIIRESLRLYPPATSISREVRAGGYDLTPDIHLPAGITVFSALYAYQRDPDYWPAPLEFRPERWLPEGKALAPTTEHAWTPFGMGARICVGWRFAIQEAKTTLVQLYRHATYELLPGQEPLAVVQNLTLSPKHGVRVRVHPRA